MFKKLSLLVAGFVTSLVLTGEVYAAKQVSVRLSQPKSPTNQTSFNINFVALDLLGRTVTVKCFQQGPSDGAMSQFGSTQSLSSGGNSGSCSVDGSVMNDGAGSYTFKVEATAGDGTGDNFDDDSTTITFDNSGPGDVKDYNKEKNACEYKIHFKTADDSGATVKVELYRSDAVPFNADSGSLIQSMTIGSNEAKDTTDSPSDCSKSYYYAVRAFDSAGNGSALVGDNVNQITVINPTPGQAQGAIPVSSGQGGSVLGQESGAGSVGATGVSGETLGETSPSAEVVDLEKKDADKTSLAKNLGVGGGILALGALLYAIWKKRQNQSQTPI